MNKNCLHSHVHNRHLLVHLQCPINFKNSPYKVFKNLLYNVQFLSIWSRSNSPPSWKMSLCVPRSPFQRVWLPLTGDRGRESTLHAESLSRSSYEESSSSSSSSSRATSRRDSRPSSGKAVKCDWMEFSEVGASRSDWLPSVDENPGQLKLWKVWSFCRKEGKKEEMLVCISHSELTSLLLYPLLLKDYSTGPIQFCTGGTFLAYLCNTGAKNHLIMWEFFSSLGAEPQQQELPVFHYCRLSKGKCKTRNGILNCHYPMVKLWCIIMKLHVTLTLLLTENLPRVAPRDDKLLFLSSHNYSLWKQLM